MIKMTCPRKHHVMIAIWLLLASYSSFNQVLAQTDNKGADQGPSLQDSLTTPIITTENRSVLLTCVVRNLGNYSLLWKYGVNTVLTAGTVRITTDSRFSVLHDKGGDVYVLQINNVTHNDTGLYVCEVNTEPALRSFHRLSVLTDKLVAPAPPEKINTTTVEALWGFSAPAPINHNYTQCCLENEVPSECLGFCSIKNILEGTTGIHPTKCDPFFKRIVHCMADGRNHVPCCQRNNVPDVCQDMCVGQYTLQTDDVRTHLSCGAFTAPTLACIAEGIDTLPSRPERLEAENITDTSILLRWTLGANSVNPVDHFNINMTLVGDLEHPAENQDSSLTIESQSSKTKKYKVEGDARELLIDDLIPFGLYNVTMESVNKLGKSLPTYTLRILTLSKTEAALNVDKDLPGPPKVPDLPDTKQCCRNKNVTHASCVDTFCDPLAIQSISVPDVIICAPWGQQMFGCVSDHKDHTDCCRRRDIPEECVEICAGHQLSSLSQKHFKCVQHMNDISNCMLSGYDVLPSSPVKFQFSNVGTNIGILHWDVPIKHADTIDGYKVTYTLIKPGSQNDPEVKLASKSPFILEDLQPDSSYEVYVQARNFYGLGDPTTRIVFRTAKSTINDLALSTDKVYSHQDCCANAGVKDECLPMCQYNASLSQVRQLSNLCKEDMVSITKCAAGGRDHLPCCYKRGVSAECQMLCQGVQYTIDHSIYTKCLSYIGNIMLCLEEGVIDLPPPVTNFYATYVTDDSAIFVWDPVDNVDQYEIYYKKVNNNSSPASAFEHEASINVTQGNRVTITNLIKNQRYQFFIISRNEAGTSLPSSLINVNISRVAWDGQNIKGKPSAPHGIELIKAGANVLSFAWTAPVISNHDDQLKYKFTYGPFKELSQINTTSEMERTVTTVETWSTNVRLFGLTPNTQYIAYIEARSTKTNLTSDPSETIVAWTDPIVPAYAETPTVHPNEGLMEGGSMTILCIALGTPTPTVTLYLGPHPIRSEKTRHMVTTIHNITRMMADISCYVDNGFGTPMRSSRSIKIERVPKVRVYPESRVILAQEGQEIRLECEADAWPAPTIKIGRADNQKYDEAEITTRTVGNGIYKTSLVIAQAQPKDAGDYFCSANNDHGTATENNIKVIVNDPRSKSQDMLQCCKNSGVKPQCLGICTFNLDLDFLFFDKECIPEFDKVMACGSDGSDHRFCCSNNGVPRDCLDWCRGLPSKSTGELCALDHAKTIGQCFHEGQYTLPGPPTNIRVTPTSASTAVAKWDPPLKNAQVVELYRILWRAEGSVHAQKVDTSRTKITLENLIPGLTYELVIKAGNANGTSQLTQPLKFITADEYIVETSRAYSQTPSLVGALMAVVLLLVLVAFAVWYYKSGGKFLMSSGSNSANTSTTTRSFENPYFNQEVTMSNLQANDVSGSTMAEAMASVENATNDEIQMDNVASDSTEDSKDSTGKKWPKFPSTSGFNNGFGFQRFQ